MAPSVTLNTLPPSANSACARCILACSGIAFKEENVYGKTRTPEYLAKFPTNLAPSIEHDGVCVSENGAIARYLVAAFPSNAGKFYPAADPKLRAKIDMVYDYTSCSIYPLISKAMYPTVGFPMGAGDVNAMSETNEFTAESQAAAAAALLELLEAKYVNGWLKNTTFLTGESPTIADFRFGPIMLFARVGMVLPERINKYLADLESKVPGYKDAVAPVAGFTADKVKVAVAPDPSYLETVKTGHTWTQSEYFHYLKHGTTAGANNDVVKIYYWPMHGRAGALFRMLEHAGIKYEHISDFQAIASKGSAWKGSGKTFAPPIVVDGKYEISQSTATCLYIGKKAGLIPKGFDECKANQYMGDIVDVFENNLGKSNEDGATLKAFLTGERWEKLMSNIERSIMGPYYFGGEPSAVDFFLLAHLDFRFAGLFERLQKQTGVDYFKKYPKVKAVAEQLRAFPAYKNYSGKVEICSAQYKAKDDVFKAFG